mgnify:CR=1 FL=1
MRWIKEACLRVMSSCGGVCYVTSCAVVVDICDGEWIVVEKQ